MCERGLPAVPLLIACLNLTVLARGALPLHAAAFTYRGRGIVVTGWSKGGKTESLLAFLAHGAASSATSGSTSSPTAARCTASGAHARLGLEPAPAARGVDRLDRGDRLRLGGLRPATRWRAGAAAAASRPSSSVSATSTSPPEQIFDHGAVRLSTPFDRLFLVASRDDPATVAREVAPQEVARRMAASLDYERAPLPAAYGQFRFAFPDRRNDLFEIRRDARARAPAAGLRRQTGLRDRPSLPRRPQPPCSGSWTPSAEDATPCGAGGARPPCPRAWRAFVPGQRSRRRGASASSSAQARRSTASSTRAEPQPPGHDSSTTSRSALRSSRAAGARATSSACALVAHPALSMSACSSSDQKASAGAGIQRSPPPLPAGQDRVGGSRRQLAVASEGQLVHHVRA